MQYGASEVALCHGGVNFKDAEHYVTTVRAKAKQAVKQLMFKSHVGTNLALRFIKNTRASNAIKMYDTLEFTPDVVIFNDADVHEQFVDAHPHYSGIKIQILHNNGEWGKMLSIAMPKIDRDRIKALEGFVIDDSDVIVFVGEKNKERFNAAHPEVSRKTAHIHLGIEDLGQGIVAGRSSDRFVFVCVGTVCERKNQRILMDVAEDPEIARRVRFVVVGDGPDYESCKKEAQDRNLCDRVEYVGGSDRVADYYREANGLISVSHDEGLPTVAIEAMSFGLPLLLTDVGGCAELINGNGLLIPDCSTTNIIAGVKSFLALFDAGEISGNTSREMYERHYTIDAMWSEYVTLLKKLGVDRAKSVR